MEELETVLSEQELGESEKELINEAYNRLKIWRDGCKEIQDRARDARDIMLLQDPYQDPGDADPNHKTLQLQSLRSTIVNCVADQMDNMPEAIMLPEREELRQKADDLTDVVRFVLAQNDYEEIHGSLAEDFFVAGTYVVQVTWDRDMNRGEGNIAILRWPLEGFLWDPKCNTIEEARAIINVSWHPLSWYRSRYPKEGRYVAPESYEHDGVGMPDNWDELANEEPMAMLMEYWWREYDSETHTHKINVAYIAGGALLYLKRDIYAHGMYPFIVCPMGTIEGLPVGEGMVQTLAPMMRYVNRYARYIDENASMAAKIRMLVRENANIDIESLADWDKNLIRGDSIDEDSVRWFQSKPLNNVTFNQMLQFQTDIKQDSGQNQFTRGETAGGVTAASAISALQEAGGKITRLHTGKINNGFRQMVEQVIWLIAQFYTGRQARMVTGRDGVLRSAIMDAQVLMGETPDPQMMRQLAVAREKEDRIRGVLPAPPYSVQIQVQRRNPLRVQAQNELMIQAYTMAVQNNAQFPLSTLFDTMTVDGKETIVKMLREAEARADQMQQMAAQMQQMQQENDALKKTAQEYGKKMRETETASIADMPQGLPIKPETQI